MEDDGNGKEGTDEKLLSGMSDKEIATRKKAAIKEYEEREKEKLRDLSQTDMGNAELFNANYGHKLAYCKHWNSWLIWNGHKWKEDMSLQVQEWAKECMRALYNKAFDMRDKEMRNWAYRSASRSRIESLIKLSQSEPGIPKSPGDFDNNSLILNLQNGVLDLEKGKLDLPLATCYCSKIGNVNYDPDAECNLWHNFLDRIMGGNLDLIGFLQRAAGYSLTGSTKEQCLFVLHGLGANGKSTFIATIFHMLGDYAGQLRSETLILQRLDQIPSDIARMKGKRFVAVQETPQGRRLNESLVKQLTGQDKIAARALYQNEFEFEPHFKIWLSTNHKPDIWGRDLAIWRRINLIPFDVVIPEPEQDKELLPKLIKESPGILNWALEGLRMWKAHGLIIPKEVKEATSDYRSEQDVMEDFLENKCIREGEVQSSILYEAYKNWSDTNGEKNQSNRWLAFRLKERGFVNSRTNRGVEWNGLSLSGS